MNTHQMIYLNSFFFAAKRSYFGELFLEDCFFYMEGVELKKTN